MDDQSHIFQLLFQEQIDDYKQSLTSIDDLFEQKKEQPVTITESIDYLFEKGDFLADQNLPNQSPGISVPSNSPNSSTNSSTTISGFLIDEEIVLKESSSQSEDISAPIESSSRASFSCNGTSELPLHIQDVRERVKRELGVTTNLHLTDEERKLLMEEGVDLPEDLPLTKAEERVLKKVRRKIRNKRSAMESRRRKKEYITTVEEQYESSKDENDELKKRVKFLEQQNRNLMSQLRKLQESVMSIPKSGHACALGVVIFSLFVFCYPGSTGPFLILETKDFSSPITIDGFKSRKILQVDSTGLDYDYIEFQQTPIESDSENEEQSKNLNSTTEIKGPRDVVGTQNGTKVGTAVPPVPARTFEEAEIVNSRGYKSLMPESPEDYIKSFSTRQGEM